MISGAGLGWAGLGCRRRGPAGFCERNTPPDKKTGWKIIFKNTESAVSAAGLHGKGSRKKELLFTDTGGAREFGRARSNLPAYFSLYSRMPMVTRLCTFFSRRLPIIFVK